MLDISGLSVSFGNIAAVKEVAFTVGSGEIVALIGSNGAGKSSILQAIAGLIKPSDGKVIFSNKVISGLSSPEIVQSGIALVPEGRKIFGNLTVLENLEVGGFTRTKQENESKITELFEYFPKLKERASQSAGTLSGGEQQILAIARALMSRPKLLLLDEPSMGLSPLMVKTVFKIITDINKAGVAILLVEQNANLALKVSNRAYVVETGLITISGKSKILLFDEEVRKVYLGEH